VRESERERERERERRRTVRRGKKKQRIFDVITQKKTPTKKMKMRRSSER